MMARPRRRGGQVGARSGGHPRRRPSIELSAAVDVAAPAERVWHAMTDWERQGDWMLRTRVEATGSGGTVRLRAVTSVGPLRFTDPMEVVEWTPPSRCVVRHTGRVIRGDGVFEVWERGPDRSVARWSELLELPFGAIGRAAWPLLRGPSRAALGLSLRRMARLVEARYRAGG
jgi:hypothetical protein